MTLSMENSLRGKQVPYPSAENLGEFSFLFRCGFSEAAFNEGEFSAVNAGLEGYKMD